MYTIVKCRLTQESQKCLCWDLFWHCLKLISNQRSKINIIEDLDMNNLHSLTGFSSFWCADILGTISADVVFPDSDVSWFSMRMNQEFRSCQRRWNTLYIENKCTARPFSILIVKQINAKHSSRTNDLWVIIV